MARKKKAKKAKGKARRTKKQEEAAHEAAQHASEGLEQPAGPDEADAVQGPPEADERSAAPLMDLDDEPLPSEEEVRQFLEDAEDIDVGGY